MLRAVGEGIKAVDPGARVITAGLNESELGIKLVPFLQGMYRAGAKGSFDVLALHPYAPGSDLVTAQLNRAIKELRRNGDPARTIVTELGWATGGPSQRALVVSELGQAALIRRTITRLARYRGQLRLEGVFYFNWRDVAAAPGSRDHWGLHTGLMREDGSVKPGMQALTDVTWAISSG
jgi:polysaccharide biosynthesis protein PslG